MIYTKK